MKASGECQRVYFKIFMVLQNIRHIVPAVRDFRAKANSTAFVRRAPRLNYAKANQRWWTHFVSDIDLYIFEKALSRSEIRLIELEDRFYVEDPRILDTVEWVRLSVWLKLPWHN